MVINLKTVTIVMIILGGVMAGLFTYSLPMWQDYGVTPDSNLTHTFSALNNSLFEMYSHEKNQSELLEGGTAISVSSVTNLVSLSERAVSYLFYPWKIARMLVGILFDITDLLGIPSWIPILIITLLLATIGFAIISAIIRWWA